MSDFSFRSAGHQADLRQDRLFLLCCVVVAGALRLDFLVANNFVIDADEAIVGLMARHILEGKDLPVFYYGQHYMGSFEALLVALSFRLFGSSAVALKLVPLLFSLAFIPVVYLLGYEVGRRHVARLAAFFAAIPPAALVVWSSMARGGFMEIVFIATLSLLFTVRWLKAADPQLFLSVLIAVLLGFGWWVNNQIIFALVPIALFMTLRLVREPKLLVVHGPLCAVAFVAGSLPFWIYNLQHKFISFKMFAVAGDGNVFKQLWELFSVALPIILGARRFWQLEDIFWGAGVFVLVSYGCLMLLYILFRTKPLLQLFKLRVGRESGLELLAAYFVCSLLIFSLSSFGWLVQAPRYLLPLYGALFVLSAYVLSHLSSFIPIFGGVAILLFSSINLASSYLGGRAVPGEPLIYAGERVAKDHGELLRWLSARNIEFVRTNYWIGYRLAFESGEKVRFMQWAEPEQVRIAGYQEEALKRGIWTLPLVLVPSQAALVKAALPLMGYSWQEKMLSGYVVLYDFIQRYQEIKPLSATQYSLTSSFKQDQAGLAVDGRIDTRWGSAKAQSPGMQFTIELAQARTIRGLRYDLGSWPQDYARALRIDLILPSGESEPLLSPEVYLALRYLPENRGAFELHFDAKTVKRVVLRQLGNEGVFDWSIAELTLFE